MIFLSLILLAEIIIYLKFNQNNFESSFTFFNFIFIQFTASFSNGYIKSNQFLTINYIYKSSIQ